MALFASALFSQFSASSRLRQGASPQETPVFRILGLALRQEDAYGEALSHTSYLPLSANPRELHNGEAARIRGNMDND